MAYVKVTSEMAARAAEEAAAMPVPTDEEIEVAVASDPDAAPLLTEEGAARMRARRTRRATGLTQAGFAARYGIPLGTLAEHPSLDLTIDGADEVHTGTLDLIKGLGGALLREKIVAAASRRMVVVVDEGKLVEQLGRVPLPVEVTAFGWEATARHLRAAGAEPSLRMAAGQPYQTDGGNLILDCTLDLADPAAAQARLKAIAGVVETGLFINLASRVIAGTPSGPRILERP